MSPEREGQNNYQLKTTVIEELNNIINQLDLIDMYRKLHPATEEYVLFLIELGTLTRIDYILSYQDILYPEL